MGNRVHARHLPGNPFPAGRHADPAPGSTQVGRPPTATWKARLPLATQPTTPRRPQGRDELEARIAAYELAFRMQSHAPEAVDITQETAATRSLYGLDDKATTPFGRNCLMARRLVERGVRFIQLYSGAGSKWDAHSKIEKNHTDRCRETDIPIAGLLADLEQRGLLDGDAGDLGRRIRPDADV
ncbi:MAG: hypothetical protein Ct9H300mP1_21620 [Planctomycetaceae bacterium]|nr:MAG: hypothetical protein Ct9H300mP1_21620 [Planctomycetaceae bacterium]